MTIDTLISTEILGTKTKEQLGRPPVKRVQERKGGSVGHEGSLPGEGAQAAQVPVILIKSLNRSCSHVYSVAERRLKK